ncbi:MarR family winged helix-turn-helix transcriptional regulator [Cellulomonas sp. PhB150]|uniref:MarR family winged helix-turn-helix transcriptional regulator n=1 Tax=Cellulomonas sp. PhB150 TaxID=2485188 RepID=UPI000F499531|nr:MarR family transcriptional regulator [Cellulomonas sp. PhB150]ROS30811.1 DNA-binding MarR family transcriptional regulator [Cellulomonas sp. PhB150]
MTDAPHFWYADDPSIAELLESVRRFRRADAEMRRRVSAGMAMNVTDMQALQYVIATESRGGHAHPRDIAAYLAISTASTTKLLDRLTASGHLVRSTNPADRRSLVVTSTPHAHAEVHARLGRMHQAMAAIAAAVPDDARPALKEFLDAMSEHLDSEKGSEPLTPA